ncbi:isochorismatase family protein [Actinomycetospora termitidis]|uniref:Isochorismatase family protein n=1 Tax=Actinomycetospora termitidis TaxID=3053470 RepID=A0ABT7MFT2_9PSEU|nr:isochorismatase family protein [Actinomycetospora sp. Odt1-22]MDL5159526.1 isochorismatase family protein [Actinomycetospora sp. Odt1-22]
MSLPSIAPYPMPRAEELPSGRAGWDVDPARAVLLVHDMQRYFLAPFRRDAEPVSVLVDHVAELAAAARAAGVPVVYTAQPGEQPPEDRALLMEFWGEGPAAAYREDPDVVAIIDELAPQPGDEVLTKWRYSAFSRTPLADRLADWGRDQLLVTGIYAHIGCMVTAVDAFMRDVQPFLLADALADFSRDRHDQALEWTAQRCGMVTTTAHALAGLKTGAVVATP